MFLFRGARFSKIVFVFAICFFLSFSEALAAQSSNDTYDTGPDPIAGSLPDADKTDDDDDDILGMDLDQLSTAAVVVPAMEMAIESVSRTTTTLARTPSAVYVVTNEMIRRCGARNVPEVLRTVPGVNVARINGCSWAISIRGFNNRFAKNLLVQVDGVAIYSPTHSGVFWEREYVMLEDVERIEVIRGPGAAVWGVNAVNGVINIITKSSKDTHGIYADGGGGNEHRQFGDFRVGGKQGNLNWRVYGVTLKDDRGYVPRPLVASDRLTLNQGGFRLDWTPNRRDTFTVQGAFYGGLDHQVGTATPPATETPMHYDTTTFLTRWKRQVDEDTDWEAQMYYYNPYATGDFTNQVGTFDFDFQYHSSRGRHDVVWGFGYRNSDERWIWGAAVLVVPDSEQIPSYFIQDTVTMVEDRFFLTLGSKFDHNSVTHFEYQPTIRATWTPDERTSIWGAISRASRTPSLIERVFFRPHAEHVLSYEAGVRRAPNDRFFWELSTFFNRYDSLIGSQSFFVSKNVGKADTYGFELNANYELTKRWQVSGWYSFLVQNVVYTNGYTPYFDPGATPRNQFYLQSHWDLGRDVSLDVMFRYVDSLSAGVDSYFANDIRLAWRPTKKVELALVGQNLLAGKHYEFITSQGTEPTEIEPGVYGMASWRY